MNTEYKNIAEFIGYKQVCPFCNQSLKPLLTNFLLFENKLPVFNSKIKDNSFIFNIRYTSISANIKAKGAININTNELTFDIDSSSDYDGSVDYVKMIEVFEHLKLHIQLECSNKSCGMDYYCCSNVFSCERAKKEWGGGYYNFGSNTRIKPFLLYFDACNIDKYWIQSDSIYNVTRIISTANPVTTPVTTPFIKFDSLDKEKFKKRILTIITFS